MKSRIHNLYNGCQQGRIGISELQQEITVRVYIWTRLTLMGVYIWTQPILQAPVLLSFFFFIPMKVKVMLGVYIWTQPSVIFIHTSKRKSESMEDCQLVTISDCQLVTNTEAIKRTENISCIVSHNQTVMLWSWILRFERILNNKCKKLESRKS